MAVTVSIWSNTWHDFIGRYFLVVNDARYVFSLVTVIGEIGFEVSVDVVRLV